MIQLRTAHLLALVLILATVAVTRSQLQDIYEDKVGIICPDRQSIECKAGGIFNSDVFFKGTYMCREQSSWIFLKRNVTRCVPTIAGAVIAEKGDRCGCCGGECPVPCGCYCSNDPKPDVLLYRATLFGKEKVCVSQGKASRWIADERGSEYSCVPESECPTMAPTEAPTMTSVSVSESDVP
jgi:hypothetical protein